MPNRPAFPIRATQRIEESLICEMSRLAERHEAINLAEGLPDFAPSLSVQQALERALRDQDIHQAVNPWGLEALRSSARSYLLKRTGLHYNASDEITVTCGASEAIYLALSSMVEPGDEVLVMEPFYEPYVPMLKFLGARIKKVSLSPIDGQVTEDALRAAFSEQTKLIIINSPSNPTGHILNEESLQLLSEACQHFGVMALSDEVYSELYYNEERPRSISEFPGMKQQSFVIHSVSKSFSATGWRVGFVAAPPPYTAAIRKLHDLTTTGAPALFQHAASSLFSLHDAYFDQLRHSMNQKRQTLSNALKAAGIRFASPEGAYYIWADIRPFGFRRDVDFVHSLIKEQKVSVVPGSTFFCDPADGAAYVRFCFAKSDNTLKDAGERLLGLTKVLKLPT